MKKILLSSFLLLAVLLVVVKAQGVPDKPLDLKFTAVDGREVDFAKLRGKVVIVDFWATWCPPCRVVGPDLLAAYNKYHKDGLEVIGVSVDSDKEAVLAYLKKEGLPWPQYFDGQGDENVIAKKYGVDSFPTIWLVNKQGKVVNADFRELWAKDGGIPFVTPPATIKKVDAAIEKQLKAH